MFSSVFLTHCFCSFCFIYVFGVLGCVFVCVMFFALMPSWADLHVWVWVTILSIHAQVSRSTQQKHWAEAPANKTKTALSSCGLYLASVLTMLSCHVYLVYLVVCSVHHPWFSSSTIGRYCNGLKFKVEHLVLTCMFKWSRLWVFTIKICRTMFK